MIDLKQKELAEWQLKNFGSGETADMIIGMVEELGELAHWYLKRKQGIREGANNGSLKDEIGDAFADVIIYGLQVMTHECIDAECVLRDTTDKVLKRDWKNNPSGEGESQHKQLEPK